MKTLAKAKVSFLGLMQGKFYEIIRKIPAKNSKFYLVNVDGQKRTIPIDKFERGSANDE